MPKNLQTGRDGVVADPNACPRGLDPRRYCDMETRVPVGFAPEFYICHKCGHKGMWDHERVAEIAAARGQ